MSLLILMLLSIFGLVFLIRESDGPWGIIAWFRNLLMRIPFCGVFFFNLLNCPFCCGCHAGWIIYLLAPIPHTWQFIILWTLTGGGFTLIIDAIISRLYR